MKLFGWELSKAHTFGENDPFRRLMASMNTLGYDDVNPETCMQSPTVQAIVTAVSRRIAISPVHVFQKTVTDGRERKERLPSHPVERLLQKPNSFQTRHDYWLDAVSRFIRYGNYYAFMSRGSTGPIRELLPMSPGSVSMRQDQSTWAVTYNYNGQDLNTAKVHHARGPARNGYCGDSPVNDIKVAIGLEILAEKFGASFFENGATPFLVFSFLSNKGFRTKEEQEQFVKDFQESFTGRKRFTGMVTPAGMDKPTPIQIDNDKAQFLETRRYQRTVIAGGFGVPPHFVGDLERATFNNVEQQDTDFVINVVMPIAQAFEAAMENDLLTDEDRSGGVIIRFNLDAVQRADFKSRQEGLQIQRQNGVISANDWRERESMNPISEDDGGENFIYPANMVVAGEEPSPEENTQGREPAKNNRQS